MRVFLLGGTGAIGRHALRRMIRAGHDVSVLTRGPEAACAVRAAGAAPVVTSIFDRTALERSFHGHDVVVNLATSMPTIATFLFRRAWAPSERIRTEGSAAVVDAALAVGITRFVQESVSMIYPDRGDEWIDEEVAPDPFPNAQGNLVAEANARRFCAAGGVGVVLRFGLFYGPGARHSERFLAMARHHVVPLTGRADGFVSSIYTEDAGAAVLHALDAAAGTYNVVDDEPLTKREYGDALARAANARPILYLPGRASLLFGDRMASLTRSLRISNRRFREDTGWRARRTSAREGWIEMARRR